jgi:uncharacterized protein YraI
MKNRYTGLLLILLVSLFLLAGCDEATPETFVSLNATIQAQQLEIRQLKTQLAEKPTALTLTAAPTMTTTITLTPTEVVYFTPEITLADNTRLRLGPGTNYPILTTLISGTVIRIMERNEEGTWFKAQVVLSGATAWISSEVFEVTFNPDQIKIAENIPTPSAPTQSITRTPTP